MSLLQQTDVYQGSEEKAARKHPEFGFALALRFALALICVALALVLAGANGPNPMFGPFVFPANASDPRASLIKKRGRH